MVTRIWRGWTRPEDADSYATLLTGTIIPGILERNIPGLLGITALRRVDEPSGEVEFATIMRFADWTAVEAFAGADPTKSVVPPAAHALLVLADERSQHYEPILDR